VAQVLTHAPSSVLRSSLPLDTYPGHGFAGERLLSHGKPGGSGQRCVGCHCHLFQCSFKDVLLQCCTAEYVAKAGVECLALSVPAVPLLCRFVMRVCKHFRSQLF
jgi:hypothetical protein